MSLKNILFHNLFLNNGGVFFISRLVFFVFFTEPTQTVNIVRGEGQLSFMYEKLNMETYWKVS
jgi:hypothetical protein